MTCEAAVVIGRQHGFIIAVSTAAGVDRRMFASGHRAGTGLTGPVGHPHFPPLVSGPCCWKNAVKGASFRAVADYRVGSRKWV